MLDVWSRLPQAIETLLHRPNIHVQSSERLYRCKLRPVMTASTATRGHAAAAAPPSSQDVAVIGAGAAGLVAARELQREGHSVTVFEQGSDVGGVWRYEPETEDDPLGRYARRRRIHSSMYSTLRTNLPREIMSYTDFPFLPAAMQGLSTDSRQFCGHEEVHAYLKAFTAAFDLRKLVQFNTRVIRALPLATDESQKAEGSTAGSDSRAANRSSDRTQLRWQLETEAVASTDRAPRTDSHATQTFDALLVCNGHYSEPRLPDGAGADDFPGRQMHTHNYRDAGPFSGQRVVVVGASASGEDISREIADTASQVYLSARAWDPDTRQIGSRRNIRRMPAFQGLAADGSVLFEHDQTAENIDTVVYATGYVYSFPFLEEARVVTVKDNRVSPLYQHIWPPAHAPSIAFIGLPWKVVPFPQYELQSRWVARVLSGRVQLPSEQEMQEHIEAFYAQMESDGIHPRFTHRLNGDLQWKYNNWLSAACGPDIPSMPHWRPALYDEASANKRASPEDYRDTSLDGTYVQQAHQDAASLQKAIPCAA